MYADLELFEYLIMEHDEQYSVDFICNDLRKFMKEDRYIVDNYYYWNGEKWTNRDFLKKVEQICVERKCNNDAEKYMITNCISVDRN